MLFLKHRAHGLRNWGGLTHFFYSAKHGQKKDYPIPILEAGDGVRGSPFIGQAAAKDRLIPNERDALKLVKRIETKWTTVRGVHVKGNTFDNRYRTLFGGKKR